MPSTRTPDASKNSTLDKAAWAKARPLYFLHRLKQGVRNARSGERASPHSFPHHAEN
jgi:hypothetical protein